MKFPAVKAFSATLAYLARHGLDLLKALWLPALLLVGLQIYALPPFFSGLAELLALGENPAPTDAAAALAKTAQWMLLLIAGSAILFPMMTVASLVHLLRGEQLKTPFYFRYGGDELRVLAAYILLSLMIMMISIVGGLAVSTIALLFLLVGQQARGAANGLGELILNLALVWFRLRLCVLYPASLATRTIGFGAAWATTKGHALRLLFYWLLVGLVFLPLAALLTAPFMARLFPLLAALSATQGDPAAAREAVIPILETLAAMFRPDNPSFALFAAALFLATVVSAAFGNVAAGTAWRYLNDRGAPDSAPAQNALAA